jgi:hypothetical protein
MTEIERLRKLVERATRDSERAAEALTALPAGSSRARVTSANARWTRAAQHHDDIARRLAALENGTPPMLVDLVLGPEPTR